MRKTAWITVLALALVPGTVLADSFIDFGIGPGGTISYAGSGGAMIGSAIPVNDVSGLATPLNAGARLAVDFGSMNYSTGAYDAASSIPGSVWSFLPGGLVTISGCIPGLTSATCTGSNNVTLLSGSFVLPEATANGAAGMAGSISDTKNSLLLAYFGVSPAIFTGSVNQGFNGFSSSPARNSFTAGGAPGDVVNFIPSIPEPAGLALMGTGLMGLAGVVRKKLHSQKTPPVRSAGPESLPAARV